MSRYHCKVVDDMPFRKVSCVLDDDGKLSSLYILTEDRIILITRDEYEEAFGSEKWNELQEITYKAFCFIFITDFQVFLELYERLIRYDGLIGGTIDAVVRELRGNLARM